MARYAARCTREHARRDRLASRLKPGIAVTIVLALLFIMCHNTSEMQSIGRAKHTVLMVTPWPLTDCVHWHKIKINVSLYRKVLFLQLMWLKVQSFIILFMSYNTRVAKRIYRRRNTKRGCYKKRGGVNSR